MNHQRFREAMRRGLPFGLVAIAFFIYATAVLILHPGQRNDFIPERSSLAAAASNLYYGAPLGKVYSGVLDQFLIMNVPFERSVAEVVNQQVVPGALLATTADGNGIGYIVFSKIGMRLFGPHTLSVALLMLVTMGLSAAVLVWRFPDRRSLVALLYFTTLTAMLFTPLEWFDPYKIQYSIAAPERSSRCWNAARTSPNASRRSQNDARTS
jgi:hypothetical protein